MFKHFSTPSFPDLNEFYVTQTAMFRINYMNYIRLHTTCRAQSNLIEEPSRKLTTSYFLLHQMSPSMLNTSYFLSKLHFLWVHACPFSAHKNCLISNQCCSVCYFRTAEVASQNTRTKISNNTFVIHSRYEKEDTFAWRLGCRPNMCTYVYVG